jgi:signal transduction histidine kinase
LGNRDPEDFFKPFFTTKLQGTGLGLHIVRKIMDSHQGKVRLESMNGKGTRAVLTFPTRLKVYETETHHFGYR